MDRVLVISQSHLARDPRVRRTVRVLLDDGWQVEGLFLDARQVGENLRTWRFPLDHKRNGVLRYLVEYSSFFVWSLLWVVWRVLVGRPALVYVNSPPDLLVFAALPARLLGVPVVLDEHDPMPELFAAKGRRSVITRRLLLAQERWSIRFANRVITVHEPLQQLFESRVPGVPIDVIMNVPDLEGWDSVSWDAGSRVLVFTGTVAVRYGLDDVIRAMSLTYRKIPGIRLRVVGDGEDLEALKALAGELGVEDRLDCVGRVDHQEIPSFLAGAWVGVNVPKPDELGSLSFSNKIVEWVMLGFPVIAGRTQTLLRYFPEGTLLYVDPGSPESIAERLVELDQMGRDDVERNLERARAAVAQIAWPIQRANLIRVIRETVDA